jgi:DnaJ-like protein
MAFDRIAELKLRQAIEEGLLEDLPNSGEPLDLEEYFSMPEHVRMAYSILKNANCLPEELELRNEIARLDRALAAVGDADARERVQRQIADATLRLNILLERNKRAR